MKLTERISKLLSGKKSGTAIVVAGVSGLCLIMVSSIGKSGGENAGKPEKEHESGKNITEEVDYCEEVQEKMTAFLRNVSGVGEVQVMVTVNSREEYVYATEGRKVNSDNKTEEENQYVMIGGSTSKSALALTVKSPEISGVVIACTGSASPAVQESIYRTVSTAFDIPVSRIYVTQLTVDN